MNANKTVAMLLLGSQKIDRMANEIRQLVGMVIGLANKIDSRYVERLHAGDENEECIWSVTGENWDGQNMSRSKKIVVTCFSKSENLEKRMVLGGVIYSSCHIPSEGREYIQSDFVALIHRNLGIFLDIMIRNYPTLEEKWKFLVEAGGSNSAAIHSADATYGIGKSTDEPKSPTTFRTHEKTRLDELAERDGTTVTALVNQAVEEFLERREK